MAAMSRNSLSDDNEEGAGTEIAVFANIPALRSAIRRARGSRGGLDRVLCLAKGAVYAAAQLPGAARPGIRPKATVGGFVCLGWRGIIPSLGLTIVIETSPRPGGIGRIGLCRPTII